MKKFFSLIAIALLSFSFQRDASLDAPKVAICIIGSDSTPDYTSMNSIVSLLQQNGYSVYKFYDPNNQWEGIKRVASEASIVVYSGHGTEMGIDGNYGGLVIDDFISGQRIADELHFNRKALVIYSSVCGGAGSSASDESDIGLEESKRRVLGSALPFLMAGAGAYFAINQVGGAEKFLVNWLNQTNLSDGFTQVSSPWYSVEFNSSFRDYRIAPSMQMGIASKKGGGISTVTSTRNGVTTVRQRVSPKSYEVAYLGDPYFTQRQSLMTNGY
jgi:hypothetical protein